MLRDQLDERSLALRQAQGERINVPFVVSLSNHGGAKGSGKDMVDYRYSSLSVFAYLVEGNMRKYTAVLFPDTQGGYTVVVPALPGCITEGDTVEEALDMAKEAIELYVESCIAHGEEVQEETLPPVIATVEVRVPSKRRDESMPTASAFRSEIQARLNAATGQGVAYVDINARDVHLQLGGYPNGGHHRMPNCCSVMHGEMRPGDRVLEGPPSGRGATLTIRYKLPR